MGKKEKRERKKAIIQKYLPNCTSTWSVYTYGNLPKSKIDGACRSYAGSVDYSDVFGLIDETVFGSGKKGFLFTADGFYNDSSSGFCRYSDGISYKSLPPSYNLTAMNEMLDKLYQIEAEPSGWDIAGALFEGAIDLLQTLAESTDVAENTETFKNGDTPKEKFIESTVVETDKTGEIDSKDEMYILITYLEYQDTCIQSLLKETDSSEALNILRDIHVEDIEAERKCEYIIKAVDEASDIIREESAYMFEKQSYRFQNKVKYYISELEICDAEEKNDILEDCKIVAIGYQRILKREISQLKQISSLLE